ncbi:hypothetical protein HDU99_005823 [Rhizoclosmatium hyalinum]|nr:hypothetical protein HDU99_005823 [Rhizoclosmatium hyalinum]
MLSRRALANISRPSVLGAGADAAAANPYSETNRNGIVNLGRAENKLMDSEVIELLPLRAAPSHLPYGLYRGTLSLRTNIAALFNHRLSLSPSFKLNPDQLAIANGATPLTSCAAQIVGDEGDAILSPAPVYGSFGRDVEASSGLRFVTVNPLDNRSNSEVISPSKRVKRDIEEYPSINQLNNALDKDPRIKALLLTNPGNPSGRIIPRETLLAYLKWANSKNLHVIVDEVYAFSVWNLDAQNKFLSALEVGEDVIRKDLVHVIWSFSKDFCMNGQRAAVIMYV